MEAAILQQSGRELYPQQRTQEKARPYSLPGKAARQSAAEEALLFGKGERFGGIAPPGDSRGRAQANEGKQPVAVAADGQAHSDNKRGQHETTLPPPDSRRNNKMQTPLQLQRICALLQQACSSYPGGMRAVRQAMADKKGVSERSESTFYANMNPNGAGKLKMEEFMGVMEVTGDLRALRCLAAFFGQSLVPLEAAEPDAPTVEAEMLQDYPAVVEFHAAAKRYQEGKETSVEVLTRLEAAVLDLRQTASMALEHGKK